MKEIKEKTTPSDFTFTKSLAMANGEFQKAQSLLLELTDALVIAREEIQWRVSEHSCCVGHELDALIKIDAALARIRKIS